MIRRMLIALMVSTVSLSVAAADYDPPLLERTGLVQELVPALNDVVIYGERFTVSYTAEIEIGSPSTKSERIESAGGKLFERAELR